MANPKLQDTLEVFNFKLDELKLVMQEKIDFNSKLSAYSKNYDEKNINLLTNIDRKIQQINSIKIQIDSDVLDKNTENIRILFDSKLKELETITQRNKSNHLQISQDYIENFKRESRKTDKHFHFFVWCIGIMGSIIVILSLIVYFTTQSRNNLEQERNSARGKVYFMEKFLKEKNMKEKYFKWLEDQP